MNEPDHNPFTFVKSADANAADTDGRPVEPPSQALPQRLPVLPEGLLGRLWWEGLRTALFMRPAWPRVHATPLAIVLLLAVASGAGVLLERLLIAGQARFHAPSLLMGWFPTAAAVWACWLLASHQQGPHGEAVHHAGPARAAEVFAVLMAQLLPMALIAGLLLVPMARSEDFAGTVTGQWIVWSTWIGLMLWSFLAQAVLLWRSSVRPVWPRLAGVAVMVCAGLLQTWVHPARHWYPDAAASQAAQADDGDDGVEEAAYAPPSFTQEEIEAQTGVLPRRLAELRPLRRGEPGLYAVTFAPNGSEDVFLRESRMVASVMQQRFGAAGHTIELVNHRDTISQWPWATPLNLQRTIAHIGRIMDREHDVLFIHLTSHGAADGELAAEFEPLAVDPVTPQALRQWLDEAGIRWRVISISACYSGSWLPALAEPHTLVMTAADADHTSYGCGRRSPLTFFGRAMYDEQLRQHRSFEQAHAAARIVIAQREQQAGKTDGYSNPQIRMGEAIRPRLAALVGALERPAAH